jgi:hypothetical protein
MQLVGQFMLLRLEVFKISSSPYESNATFTVYDPSRINGFVSYALGG